MPIDSQQQSAPADKESASPAANSAPSAAPTISLPKGGGAIRGIGEKFSNNPVSGTGSMSVPIATTPGRSGFGPQLTLSRRVQLVHGYHGHGWQSRRISHPTYLVDDVFYGCAGFQLQFDRGTTDGIRIGGEEKNGNGHLRLYILQARGTIGKRQK